jgi:hypothetical protein
MDKTTPKLTATELANLWTQYMNDSMAICVQKYMLEKVEDPDIRSILEFGLSLAQRHIGCIKEFFTGENYPIPDGFTEKDVNVKAPRLFLDSFFLRYIHVMAMHGLTGYAIALNTSVRSDQRKFYIQCNNETMELLDRSVDLLLSKGIYARPPYIYPPEKNRYVKKQNFLTGWFGNRRPLNGIEISNITFNMMKTTLGKAMVLGFGQVAKLNDVRNYLMRGTQLSSKHVEIFSSLLHEDNLPSPPSWDSEVTNSTETPFSDKLMLFHTNLLTSTAAAFYGAALAVSMRRDLAAQYTRLTAEMVQYAEDGANLLIAHEWLEQPPTADDRVALANVIKK